MLRLSSLYDYPSSLMLRLSSLNDYLGVLMLRHGSLCDCFRELTLENNPAFPTITKRFVLNSGAHVSFDPDASTKGQVDVLLLPLSILRHHQDLLPRRQVQSEQHRPTRQVVLQFPVGLSICDLYVCYC